MKRGLKVAFVGHCDGLIKMAYEHMSKQKSPKVGEVCTVEGCSHPDTVRIKEYPNFKFEGLEYEWLKKCWKPVEPVKLINKELASIGIRRIERECEPDKKTAVPDLEPIEI